jgi:predicted dehydrogenase
MLKVLVIGGGNIAGGFDAAAAAGALPRTHAGAYRAHGGFELAACVEPDPDRRAAFVQRWNVAQAFATLGEVLAKGLRFDVVSICSPTGQHHEHLMACSELGARVVFCEKPMCSTVDEAERALRHLDAHDITVAVNHNRRWDPAVTGLRDEIAGGHWGRLRSVTGHYNKGVLNNGSHLVDMLHLLAGPLELVHAGPPAYDHWPDDPSVPALLLAGAVPVALNCGHAADYSLFELQLVLERATIAMEDGGLRWRVRLAEPSPQFAGYRALTPGELRPGRYLECMSLAVQNIHDAVRKGSPLASTARTALDAQRLCERMRTLARSSPVS